MPDVLLGRPFQSESKKDRLRNNGLSIVMLLMFFASWVAQIAIGIRVYNNARTEDGWSPVTIGQYLRSGHFLEATAENWESEFLQMAVFVYFTSFLYQKGSPESKDPEKSEPEAPLMPESPWAAHQRGIVLKVYENSLTLALLGLFLFSFILHLVGGASLYSEEQVRRGLSPVSTFQFLGTSEFWFQSMQNWQSEFLSIAAFVILSIFLRQKGSAESKDVNTPNGENE